MPRLTKKIAEVKEESRKPLLGLTPVRRLG